MNSTLCDIDGSKDDLDKYMSVYKSMLELIDYHVEAIATATLTKYR